MFGGQCSLFSPFKLAKVVVADRTAVLHVLQTINAEWDQAAASEYTVGSTHHRVSNLIRLCVYICGDL